MSSETHIFALFSLDADTLSAPAHTARATPRAVRNHDTELVHRLYRVIRIRPQEHIILFGKKYACEVLLEEITSTYVTFHVVRHTKITPLRPIINLWLPLLEKTALEQALYAATVMGVHNIYFIETTKGKRKALSPMELERCARIMIGAAEQSKQFCLPVLHAPVPWEKLPVPSQPIIADIDGTSFAECIQNINTQMPCTIIIGPSGDFTVEEKEKLASLSIAKVKLVPSVLRSEDAVMVSLGIMRSMLNT